MTIIVVAMLALTYYQYIATEQVKGQVDHKSINGVLDSTSYTLVMYTPHGINVKNPQIRDLVPENATDLTESQEQVLIDELRGQGYSLYFVLNVRASTRDPVNGMNPGDTLGYIVGQDIFLGFDMGDNITYEVPHNERATIRSAR